MLELYKNIRKFRKMRGWTQAELADRVGYTSHSAIAKIEAGKSDLPQSQIRKFAQALGVPAGELMGSVQVTMEDLNDEERQIVRSYRIAGSETKNAVTAILHVVRFEYDLDQPFAMVAELSGEVYRLTDREARHRSGEARHDLMELSAKDRREAADLKSAQEKRTEIVKLIDDFDQFTAAEKNEIAKSVLKSCTWDGETLKLVL